MRFSKSHCSRTSSLVLEQWLLENLISSYQEYNLSILQKAAEKRPKADTEKIKRKMEKLKDLYLNDLIDRDAYEKDYTALRDELRKLQMPEEPSRQPIDLSPIQTVLNAYEWLSRQEKKEFWSRTVGKIVITNSDCFFVEPIRHN